MACSLSLDPSSFVSVVSVLSGASGGRPACSMLAAWSKLAVLFPLIASSIWFASVSSAASLCMPLSTQNWLAFCDRVDGGTKYHNQCRVVFALSRRITHACTLSSYDTCNQSRCMIHVTSLVILETHVSVACPLNHIPNHPHLPVAHAGLLEEHSEK